MVMMRGELDQWKPGEHTGTFRGNNLAFVAATELLSYWENDNLSKAVYNKEKIIKEKLTGIKDQYPEIQADVRGRGMIYGLKVPLMGFSSSVSEEAFSRYLLIELAGANDDVLKLLPPLTIENDLLREGLQIIEDSVQVVMERREAILEGLNHDSQNPG
jgi:diaminobutyrate-2-oxoglutarate transaminase